MSFAANRQRLSLGTVPGNQDRCICIIKPNDAEAWQQKGITNNNSYTVQEALADFARTLELSSTYRDAASGYSMAVMNEGRFEEALRAFERIIAIDSNDEAG